MPSRHELGPALLLAASLLISSGAAEAGLDRECVLRLAETAEDAMTLAEIRKACRSEAAAAGDASGVQTEACSDRGVRPGSAAGPADVQPSPSSRMRDRVPG